MTEKMIRDAYCKIRTIDQTIPDDVLDFMKDVSIEKINQINNTNSEITLAIELYVQHINEKIDTIKIWTPSLYLINNKWTVDISLNKVSRSYPDPE